MDTSSSDVRRLKPQFCKGELRANASFIHFRKDKAVQLLRLQQIAQKMPLEYERNAGYLFRYLHRLIEHTEQNRMTPANLAIIFGPSLLNPPSSNLSSPNSEDHPSMASMESNSVSGQQNGYAVLV